jgi:hypothetical protein
MLAPRSVDANFVARLEESTGEELAGVGAARDDSTISSIERV